MARRFKADFHKFRAIFVIIGGILVLTTLGSMYSCGNMAPYIVSYCRARGTDPNLSYQTGSFILAAMLLGQGLSMCAGGYLERKLGVRLATFIGAAVFSLSVFVSAWTITISFYFLLFTYGLLLGIGTGLAYVPPLVCVMKWMPHSKGVVNGILLAGFGLGAFIFNFVQTGFINPYNLNPDVIIDEEKAEQVFFSQEFILDRVPFSFIVQGIIFVVMQLIGIVLLGDPPSIIKRSRRYAVRRKQRGVNEKSSILMNEKPLAKAEVGQAATEDSGETSPDVDDVENQPSTSAGTGATTSASTAIEKLPQGGAVKESGEPGRPPPEVPGDHDKRWSGRSMSPLEMAKDAFFWQLVVALFLDGFSMVYVATLYKAFGQTFIRNDILLAVVGSVASIFNAAGRIFWGYIADKFSFKVSFLILSALFAAFIFTFGLSRFGHNGKEAMFFIWVCAMFFFIGGTFSTAITGTARAYGSDFVGMNYGLVYLVGISIPAVIVIATQQLTLAYLSWQTLFLISGAFPATSVFIAMFFNIKTPDGIDI